MARTGSISVVRVHGPLSRAVGQARNAALVELADPPAAVVCDLSGVTGPHEPWAVSLLASLGAHARHWPGTPVGVLCPDDALHRALEREVLSRHLRIAASQSVLWPLLSEGWPAPPSRSRWCWLPRHSRPGPHATWFPGRAWTGVPGGDRRPGGRRPAEAADRPAQRLVDEASWTDLIRDHLFSRKGHATRQRLRTDPAGTPRPRV